MKNAFRRYREMRNLNILFLLLCPCKSVTQGLKTNSRCGLILFVLWGAVATPATGNWHGLSSLLSPYTDVGWVHSKISRVRIDLESVSMWPGIRVIIPAFLQNFWLQWHGIRVKQTQKWVWPHGTQIRVNSDLRVFRMYHPSEAWLVEQKALPPQLYEAMV